MCYVAVAGLAFAVLPFAFSMRIRIAISDIGPFAITSVTANLIILLAIHHAFAFGGGYR